jgi:3-oxoacyl-[acyl-carrier-protein] synthase III
VAARRACVAGWGKYVPTTVVTNFDLSRTLDTSDEWIRSRTGIAERRVAGPDEATASMATIAGRNALTVAGVAPEDVDCVLVATCTPDYSMPATANLVQAGIGAARAGACDINAACSGFVYALAMADSCIRAGLFQTVLVIGAETFSRIVDWNDRATCVLFGDGAGALLLRATDEEYGLLSTTVGSDGSRADLLLVPAGGSKVPTTVGTIRDRLHMIRMDGREVFRFAVSVLPRITAQVVAAAGWTLPDVDLFVAHQANVRIIQSAARSLGLPDEKVYVNVHRYGNTSAASIPIALCEAQEEGRLHDGSAVVLAGFGSGLSWAATALRWGPVPSRLPVSAAAPAGASHD